MARATRSEDVFGEYVLYLSAKEAELLYNLTDFAMMIADEKKPGAAHLENITQALGGVIDAPDAPH